MEKTVTVSLESMQKIYAALEEAHKLAVEKAQVSMLDKDRHFAARMFAAKGFAYLAIIEV